MADQLPLPPFSVPGRFTLEQRAAYLRRVCAGRSVLHLGCTNWPYQKQSLADDRYIHYVLQKVASELYGLDADQAGLQFLAGQGVPNLVHADLEDLDRAPIARTFDVVVAGEVIEHLSNPGQLLQGVRRFLRPDSLLVLTTINAYCGFRLALYALRGRGGRQEPVHPDHVAYYSYATLGRLLMRAGFQVERFSFYDIGRDDRPYLRPAVRMLNDVLTWFAPQLADGVIAECRLRSALDRT